MFEVRPPSLANCKPRTRFRNYKAQSRERERSVPSSLVLGDGSGLNAGSDAGPSFGDRKVEPHEGKTIRKTRAEEKGEKRNAGVQVCWLFGAIIEVERIPALECAGDAMVDGKHGRVLFQSSPSDSSGDGGDPAGTQPRLFVGRLRWHRLA